MKSVDASNASKMFDLCALNRDFVFTAIITSAFKTAVKGKVRMWMIMIKIRIATATGEGCCNLSPNTRSASHPEWVVSLEFMAYSRLFSTDCQLNEALSLLVKFQMSCV